MVVGYEASKYVRIEWLHVTSSGVFFRVHTTVCMANVYTKVYVNFAASYSRFIAMFLADVMLALVQQCAVKHRWPNPSNAAISPIFHSH